jgi:hypothetical protein
LLLVQKEPLLLQLLRLLCLLPLGLLLQLLLQRYLPLLELLLLQLLLQLLLLDLLLLLEQLLLQLQRLRRHADRRCEHEQDGNSHVLDHGCLHPGVGNARLRLWFAFSLYVGGIRAVSTDFFGPAQSLYCATRRGRGRCGLARLMAQ